MQLKDFLKETFGGNFLKLALFVRKNAPAHRALATEKKLEYLCFQIHDHPLYSPDLAPSDNHMFPRPKIKFNFAIFRPTWSSLLPRRPVWTDKFLNFLSVLQGI